MKGKYVFRRILWGLLLVFIFGGSVFAQQKKLTINLKNGSFAQLTDQIKKQSDYTFFFNNAMVMSLKKITIQVKEVTLDSVLNIALKGSDLTYKIKDKTVILYAKETPEAASKTVKLQGQVNDEAGEVLPGVNVFIKGTTVGTVTDLDGNYSLVVPDVMGMEVVFTFIGKKTKEIKYTGDRFMNVMLKDSYNEMDEVQVRARANVNEIDVRAKTGVVNEVDVRRMNNKPVLDMALALQGMAPGLIVTNKGDLGSKPEIRIRGTSSLREGDAANEPLYVLDGQVISSDAFLTLNPNDIKEIKVLKDAAACALYGIKAANGVLEITSQRGTAGKMVYNYSFSGGVTLRGRRGVDMMNSKEKLELERRLENTATPGYRYSEDYYRKYHANDPNLESLIARGQQVLDSLSRINTDWFKELLRNNFYQEHNLSARGGTEQTSFYASLNYSQQGGRIPGNDIKRVTARLSVDQEITPKLYASLSVNGGYSLSNTPNGTSYSPTDLVYQLNPYETKDVNAELVSFPGRTYADLFNQYSEESSDK
ncbi:MAG: carboxypeptidase-like regulatory domain-containing protein, partial [Butyricimonas sp.]|nr:carboxypeptidase-like regulatory domain-containing protein [Butyricimonas sp.]